MWRVAVVFLCCRLLSAAALAQTPVVQMCSRAADHYLASMPTDTSKILGHRQVTAEALDCADRVSEAIAQFEAVRVPSVEDTDLGNYARLRLVGLKVGVAYDCVNAEPAPRRVRCMAKIDAAQEELNQAFAKTGLQDDPEIVYQHMKLAYLRYVVEGRTLYRGTEATLLGYRYRFLDPNGIHDDDVDEVLSRLARDQNNK